MQNNDLEDKLQIMKNREWLLTTIDNPANPFTDYNGWLLMDRALGHYTPELMARTSTPSADLFNDDEELFVMLEIVRLDLTGLYVLVTEDTFDSMITNSLD